MGRSLPHPFRPAAILVCKGEEQIAPILCNLFFDLVRYQILKIEADFFLLSFGGRGVVFGAFLNQISQLRGEIDCLGDVHLGCRQQDLITLVFLSPSLQFQLERTEQIFLLTPPESSFTCPIWASDQHRHHLLHLSKVHIFKLP